MHITFELTAVPQRITFGPNGRKKSGTKTKIAETEIRPNRSLSQKDTQGEPLR